MRTGSCGEEVKLELDLQDGWNLSRWRSSSQSGQNSQRRDPEMRVRRCSLVGSKQPGLAGGCVGRVSPGRRVSFAHEGLEWGTA